MIVPVLSAVAALSLVTAAFVDLRCRTIPDTAALLIGVTGLVAAALAGAPLTALLLAAALFMAGAVLFAVGVMGGGDVKLAAAMGFWLGPQSAPAFLLVMAVVGGLLALAVTLLQCLRPRPPAETDATPVTVPYGIAIAVSGLFILFGAQ